MPCGVRVWLQRSGTLWLLNWLLYRTHMRVLRCQRVTDLLCFQEVVVLREGLPSAKEFVTAAGVAAMHALCRVCLSPLWFGLLLCGL